MSVLMIQGTTSDAGKSVLVAGLCRLLAREGIKVAPFKPQNMALNSAVTTDGGEIGRAQALQARAAMIEPHTDMNPVLLKPNSDTGSQVIIKGQAIGNMDARRYHAYKPTAAKAVLSSFQRLREQFDVVLVEGAGSPAEINLRAGDIANMGFALRVNAPVLLISDIDRGGVFAHLTGTLALLTESERRLVQGMVINRFRGDPELLQPGIDWLEKDAGLPVLGTLPFLHNLDLEGEDSLSRRGSRNKTCGGLNITIPALPHLSNHTDFDALASLEKINLTYAQSCDDISPCDLLILPGSKNVRLDLQWLQAGGFEAAIKRHLRYGGRLIGICGGFQMLGNKIADPLGIEGDAGATRGLALLDMETHLSAQKQLRNVTGWLTLNDSPVTGYEIHAGVTSGPALERPALTLEGAPDGALSNDNQILGTYLHGLFDEAESCTALLRWAGAKDIEAVDFKARGEREIDRLADMLADHLNMDRIYELLDITGRLTR